jgi:hypothetical protein
MNEVAGGVEQLEAAVRHLGLEQVDLLGAGDRVVAALDQERGLSKPFQIWQE